MYELELDNYRIQSMGADGGHKYVIAQIEYKGIKRRLLATFLNKSDENKLRESIPIRIKGELVDEGEAGFIIIKNNN